MLRVLILCTGNSARFQMVGALLGDTGGNRVGVSSPGGRLFRPSDRSREQLLSRMRKVSHEGWQDLLCASLDRHDRDSMEIDASWVDREEPRTVLQAGA